MLPEKELKKKIVGENEIIEVKNYSDRMYTRYIFGEGDPKQLIKIECIANNLPYYVCLVQPKEGILSTYISKRILLF